MVVWLRNLFFWDVLLLHWLIGSRCNEETVPLASVVWRSEVLCPRA
jgi:hypothetical protein